MRKMFLGICYLLISHGLSAQQIAGQVTDASTGSPVALATVELSNIATITTSESGQFAFQKVKQGRYALHITSVGYRAVDTTVVPGTALSIRLTRVNLFMQPVEVRAIRAGEKAPFAKTDLSKKDIEKINIGQDLPILLNQTPSAVVSSDAGNGVGYTGVRIRGTDGTRINVTLNGIPYNDVESQGSFFVNMPDFTSSVNNIQIQRGVGTSSNGAGAFGATINLSTNETNTTAYGEINNSYGSFNTWKHTIKAGSGLIGDHFTIDARLSKIGSDGFVDRGSSDLRSFYLSGAYLSKTTSVRLNVISGKEKTFQSWNGVPEAKLNNDKDALLTHYYNNLGTLYFTPQDSVNLFNSDPRKYNYFTYANQTDNYQQDHYQLFINQEISSKLTANAAFFLTKGKGYYEEYKPQQKYADYGLPDFEMGGVVNKTTDLIRQLWLDNDFYGLIYSLQYKNVNDQFTIGGGYNRYDGRHFGDVIWAQAGVPNNYRWYSLKAYKTDVNTYAKYQHKFSNNLEGFVDLQYRRVLYNIGGFRANPDIRVRNMYDFFNPKAGITYTNGGFMAYLSYAQGNKEPNRDDFEAGIEEQPKPEKLHDFEAGVSKKSNRYEASANLYYMLYENQLVQTGKINDVGGYTRTNVDNSYRMGIELQAGVKATQWLRVSGNLTLSRNRIRDFTEYYDNYDDPDGKQVAVQHGNTDIAFSPSIIAGGAVSVIPVKDFEISLPAKYVGRQYLDNTSNKARSLSDYYVQDARVSYTLHKVLAREISLVGQVNNVFNRKYNSNGYTYSYQYGSLITENFFFPMAGTNFMIALNVKL